MQYMLYISFAKKCDKVNIHFLILFFFLLVFIGVPQGSILFSSFWFTFNNPPNYRASPVKQFSNDILLFFIAHNVNTLTNELNSNLKNKSE